MLAWLIRLIFGPNWDAEYRAGPPPDETPHVIREAEAVLREARERDRG